MYFELPYPIGKVNQLRIDPSGTIDLCEDAGYYVKIQHDKVWYIKQTNQARSSTAVEFPSIDYRDRSSLKDRGWTGDATINNLYRLPKNATPFEILFVTFEKLIFIGKHDDLELSFYLFNNQSYLSIHTGSEELAKEKFWAGV